MEYPKFLKKESAIGITALSAGVGKYIDAYHRSISNIESYGYKTLSTNDVESNKEPSASAEERAEEFHELLKNKEISFIINATGGDFLYEVMPYIDYNTIKTNPKWFMGASDPTYLLYTITTNLDIATMYGFNAVSFDSTKLHKSQKTALDFIKGDISQQNSYFHYEKDKSSRTNFNYNLDTHTKWESLNGEINIKGRIIGGCIECLKLLPGTKYDHTEKFVEKYKKDGIIWYFDICNQSAEEFYLTLLHLREAGWFKHIKGVIVGRVGHPSQNTSLSYQEGLKKVFKNIPTIFNVDIGHTAPKMTIINGSLASIIYKDNKGTIIQELI